MRTRKLTAGGDKQNNKRNTLCTVPYPSHPTSSSTKKKGTEAAAEQWLWLKPPHMLLPCLWLSLLWVWQDLSNWPLLTQCIQKPDHEQIELHFLNLPLHGLASAWWSKLPDIRGRVETSEPDPYACLWEKKGGRLMLLSRSCRSRPPHT